MRARAIARAEAAAADLLPYIFLIHFTAVLYCERRGGSSISISPTYAHIHMYVTKCGADKCGYARGRLIE
jgi:hypothetical protein